MQFIDLFKNQKFQTTSNTMLAYKITYLTTHFFLNLKWVASLQSQI